MANRTAPCRVCGKQFIPCAKTSKEIGAFNYMEVACSEKCGKEYLKRVMEGRKKSAPTKVAETTPNTIVEDAVETAEETDTSKVNANANVNYNNNKKHGYKK